MLAGRYSGMGMVQSLGMGNDLIARGLPVDRPGLYLAVSHNSACNDAWLRGQLAKTDRIADLRGVPGCAAAQCRALEGADAGASGCP